MRIAAIAFACVLVCSSVAEAGFFGRLFGYRPAVTIRQRQTIRVPVQYGQRPQIRQVCTPQGCYYVPVIPGPAAQPAPQPQLLPVPAGN